MKKLLMIFVIGLSWMACTEEKVARYALEDDYVYFEYLTDKVTLGDSIYTYTRGVFLQNSSWSKKLRDTVYFRVNVAGVTSKKDRVIKFEQYTLEENGRKQAVPGVNFVAFDDPEIAPYMVIKADSLGAYIPIVLTYDANTAGTYQSFVLNFKLVESDDFKLMDPKVSNGPLYRARIRFGQSN